MEKNIKIFILTTFLCLTCFAIKNQNVYAFSEDVNLNLLIENKENQKELKSKIEKIHQEIEAKTKYIDNREEDNVKAEVVSVSFVENSELNSNDYLINEVKTIEKEKLELEKQLEENKVEGIKLEKSIEEDEKKYLKENNLSFKEGMWPVPSYNQISSPFGYRIHPITGERKFHRGIDIPAPKNTEIVSSDDGIVIFSGVQNGYGNVVKLKHFDGKKTVYAHNTFNVAKEGDIVKKGQVIAKVGTTGNSTGNHVHFETIIDEENINPLDAVNR